jgi:hypothetical protein
MAIKVRKIPTPWEGEGVFLIMILVNCAPQNALHLIVNKHHNIYSTLPLNEESLQRLKKKYIKVVPRRETQNYVMD